MTEMKKKLSENSPSALALALIGGIDCPKATNRGLESQLVEPKIARALLRQV